LLNLPDQGRFVGKLAGIVLGVNPLAVHVDVEYAAPAFDEPGPGTERFLNSCSQTDRLGFVVSLYAIGD